MVLTTYKSWDDPPSTLEFPKNLTPNHQKNPKKTLDDSSLSMWLTTMNSVRPLRIGLWDPFHMAELHGLYINGGYQLPLDPNNSKNMACVIISLKMKETHVLRIMLKQYLVPTHMEDI